MAALGFLARGGLGRFQVQSAYWSPGTQWGPVRPVSVRYPYTDRYSKVVLDRRGRAVATWVQGAHNIVKVAGSSTSADWRRPVPVGRAAIPRFPPANLLAGDERGDTLVSWLVDRDGVVRIDAAYRAAGGSWQDLGLVSTKEAAPGRYELDEAAAAVAPGGNAVVAWPTKSGGRLYFRELIVSQA